MDSDANLEDVGRALADVVEDVLPGWVVRCVDQRVRDYTGDLPGPEVRAAALDAGAAAREEVVPALRALLMRDVDAQTTNPLMVVREAVRFPTAVLRAAGVPPIVRDEFEERAFPDDVYGLSPASFDDIDPRLHDPGLLWGAAKAHAHLVRRRRR